MDGASERRVEGVSRVVAYIGRLISQNKALGGISVRGEVSALARKNGRIYFDLKENSDVLKCIVWSNAALKLPPFQNGNEVVVTGDFGTFAARSEYQLYVTSLEAGGTGRLYAQFEALKAKFRTEGLFEVSRKRPMPGFPARVALVFARGKGAEDFLTTMERRAPHIEISLIETRVQGDGAQMDIAEAIDRASAMPVDVIVVARGGGSYEDLFPFNLEPVVRAIVRARHPVLTAIGHTADRHLADEVADHVEETPSNAAQYFGEIRDGHLRQVDLLRRRIDSRVLDSLRVLAQRYDLATDRLGRAAVALVSSHQSNVLKLERRLEAQTPFAKLAAREKALALASARLRAASGTFARVKQQRIDTGREHLRRARIDLFRSAGNRVRLLDAQLGRFDPEATLKLGYALIYARGKLLRDASDVSAGATIEAKLARGTVRARVEETTHDE
ncbi:MAG: exodeoxyribonuclease VII large subunit [Candidatus Baltobacteraceae bacterium]